MSHLTRIYEDQELFISKFSFHQYYHMQWRLFHFLFWFHGRNNSYDLWNNCTRYGRLARILAHCSLFLHKTQFVRHQRKVQLNKPKKIVNSSALKAIIRKRVLTASVLLRSVFKMNSSFSISTSEQGIQCLKFVKPLGIVADTEIMRPYDKGFKEGHFMDLDHSCYMDIILNTRWSPAMRFPFWWIWTEVPVLPPPWSVHGKCLLPDVAVIQNPSAPQLSSWGQRLRSTVFVPLLSFHWVKENLHGRIDGVDTETGNQKLSCNKLFSHYSHIPAFARKS